VPVLPRLAPRIRPPVPILSLPPPLEDLSWTCPFDFQPPVRHPTQFFIFLYFTPPSPIVLFLSVFEPPGQGMVSTFFFFRFPKNTAFLVFHPPGRRFLFFACVTGGLAPPPPTFSGPPPRFAAPPQPLDSAMFVNCLFPVFLWVIRENDESGSSFFSPPSDVCMPVPYGFFPLMIPLA